MDHIWPYMSHICPNVANICPYMDHIWFVWPIYAHICPYMVHIWTYIAGPYMLHIWPYMGHVWPYMDHIWSDMDHLWSRKGHIWSIYDHIWPIYDPAGCSIGCAIVMAVSWRWRRAGGGSDRGRPQKLTFQKNSVRSELSIFDLSRPRKGSKIDLVRNFVFILVEWDLNS